MIPQEIIDKITQTADIAETISEYINLKKAGVNYKCVCPFHDDRDASLVVSPAKKMWKCFGCGEGGNVVSFVQKHEHVSFPEAVKIVANKYNISVPEKELSDQEKQQMKRRESLFIVLDAAQEHFTSHLSKREATGYLSGRSVPEEILKKYGAGYAPYDFSLLINTLTQKGYPTKDIIGAGLASARETKIYDRFINRITFPYRDLTGRIIGFTGRALPEENNTKTAKYLNSPDTELFSKGKTIFGLYQAKQAISKRGKALLVEGQFDVLGLAAAGYENVVCSSGTALTPEQARLLAQFTDTVTLIYDGDAAGMKASIRHIDTLLSRGFKVYATILPNGHDPDSYVKKVGKEKFDKWLAKNELNFISFMWKAHKDELNDPIKKTEVMEAIAKSIANIPSKMARQNYIQDLANKFHADIALLSQMVNKSLPSVIPDKSESPNKAKIYGMDDARQLLTHGRDELTVTYNRRIFADDWGTRPTVLVTGIPDTTDIQELRSLSYAISCRDKIEIPGSMKEPEILVFLTKLHKSGFSVNITEKVRESEDGEKVENVYSFTEYYIRLYSKFNGSAEYYHTQAIKRCADIISRADSITRNLRFGDYARMLGTTKSALELVVKPMLDQLNAEKKFKTDYSDDDDYRNFDGSTVPDYVENDPDLKRMLNAHNFFPLIDKKERKVAYIFKQKNNFVRVGNFYIEPLLHIYDKNSENNKRIVELTQRRTPHPIYMEWISKEMITMQSFRQRLWEEGDINFSNGSQSFLDAINESWEGKFKRCTELRMYGYYDEGFFAFSNAIFHEVNNKWRVDEVTDLGLVEHNGLNYYIPAFSKIYKNERRDNDKYFLDRFIMYKRPEKEISLEQWARLMDEVYKYNDNGKWAIIYAFMCAFRSDIFEVDRIFTALFFIGPTGSGKSEIAYSIRSLFMPPEAPIFNLNQGTDAAMFTLMEKYRDIPVIFDEYNDLQISDVKFQGLKAAVYDGEGKQKRKDAASKEIDSSEINSPLVICGQESPQRDDNSLSNRSIIRTVPKKDDRTEHEDAIFRELKSYEKGGLQNILLEILKNKKTIRTHYTRTQREVYKQLKDSVRQSIANTDGLSRILNTYSMFLAVCKVVENYTEFKLPFTFEEFSEIANRELIKQVESISTSNRMFTFFSTIGYLIDNGSLIEGRDFKIEAPGKITLQKQGRETYEKILDPAETNILHLSFENVYREYARTVGPRENLSKQSLLSYFQSHESWLGTSRSTRFRWRESVEATNPLRRVQVDIDQTVADPTMRRIMVEKKKTTSSIVLNYDILKDLLDIDYQRATDELSDTPGNPDNLPFTENDEKEF